MQPVRAIAFVLATSLTAGCRVGPDYKQPQAPLAEQFMGKASPASAARTQAVVLDTWWEGLGDPLLNRYVVQSLRQNLDLAQAQTRVVQARAALGLANAALVPSASVNAQAARAYQSVETPLGKVLSAAPGYDRYANHYELNLNASWDIDVFGGLRRDREAALAQYQACEAGAIATRLAVAAQTADIYTTLRGLQARSAIAQAQIKTQQDLLAKVRLLHEKGLAAEYELRQTEGELWQVQATLPVLRLGVDAALNALDVMLASPPGTHRAELARASAIPRTPQGVAIGTPRELLQRRPDLIAAERRLASTHATIGSAISQYYPTFSLSALLGSASLSGGEFLSGRASQSAALLGLRWRLFDFGRINADIEYAKGREAEALADYRKAVLTASEDVENALSALANRSSQARYLEQSEASLAQARRSSFAAYRTGAGSLITVLNADQQVLRSSDARALAQTESTRAAIALFKALGGGWSATQALSGR